MMKYYNCNHLTYFDCIVELDTHFKSLNLTPVNASWLYIEAGYSRPLDIGNKRVFNKALVEIAGSRTAYCDVTIWNTGKYFELSIDITYT